MSDKGGSGVMTRSQRQRSQSREAVPAPSSAGAKVTRASNLETVAETPPAGSQKSVRTESSMSLGMNGSQANGSRPSSPSSQFTRAQEKNELANLNDRLGKVLERLNSAEEENRFLKTQVKTIGEESSANLKSDIGKYQDELDRARKLLDELAREKDVELLAKDKALADLKENNALLAKATQQIGDLENRVRNAEKKAREATNSREEADAVLMETMDKNKRLEKDLANKTNQLDDAKDTIEQEVLARTALENALKTADEKARFETDLLESKLQRQSLSLTTVDHVNGPTSRRSGADFSASVEEMRDALEDAREEIQDNMERMYGHKLDSLETLIGSQKMTIDGLNQQVNASRKDVVDLQKDNAHLRKKTGEVERDLQQQHQKFDQHKMECATRMAAMTDSADKASQQYQELSEQYRDILNSNTELRAELEMYDKLLRDEEIRLGITSPDLNSIRSGGKKRKLMETFHTQPLSTRGAKNGRTSGGYSTPVMKSQVTRTTVKKSENKSKASGPVRILEVVPGKVVRLENTSETTVPIADWIIEQHGMSGDSAFQFGPNQVISGQSIISVYSSTETPTHDGITEILATNPWMEDSHLETRLADPEGKEMATYEVSADSNMAVDDGVRDSPRSATKSFLGFFGVK